MGFVFLRQQTAVELEHFSCLGSDETKISK